MKKATKMIDGRIEAMVREQEKTRTLHEFNFKAKINELKRDIQQMSVQQEQFSRQMLDMMCQNNNLYSANINDLGKLFEANMAGAAAKKQPVNRQSPVRVSEPLPNVKPSQYDNCLNDSTN